MSEHDTFLRQWAMLQAVPRHPAKIDTTSLQSKLAEEGYNTSTRTIQRDLKTLSYIFPLEVDERSKPYGWQWAKHASVMDIPGMAPSTALAFHLSQLFLKDLLPPATTKHLQPHFSRAKEVLNSTARRGFGAWANRVRILPRGLPLIPPVINQEVQDAVYEALLGNRKLKAIYHARHQEEIKEYEINPLGIVLRNGVIYLVCTFWNFPHIKQMALHRMQSAEVLDEKSSIPKGFSLDDYIHQKAGFSYVHSEKKLKLEVRFYNDTVKHLMETPISEDQRITKQKDGTWLLKATIADSEELRWWLLGFGTGVEVAKPAALRREFRQSAKEMSELYK